MENNDIIDPSFNNQFGQQRPLPNATAVLVLGIISIVGCIFYGVPGLVCGIIAIVLHKKDKAMYQTNPAVYEAAFKNSKAGNVCAIIGVSLSVVWVLFLIIYIFAMVTAFSMIR